VAERNKNQIISAFMKKNEKVSDYVKANCKGSREAKYEASTGWTSKTKVHENKKKYNRKDRNWQKSDSDLFFLYKTNNRQKTALYEQSTIYRIRIPDKNTINHFAVAVHSASGYH
jgi:uncharacterized protein YcnI